jgi:hypothetical protein
MLGNFVLRDTERSIKPPLNSRRQMHGCTNITNNMGEARTPSHGRISNVSGVAKPQEHGFMVKE